MLKGGKGGKVGAGGGGVTLSTAGLPTREELFTQHVKISRELGCLA